MENYLNIARQGNPMGDSTVSNPSPRNTTCVTILSRNAYLVGDHDKSCLNVVECFHFHTTMGTCHTDSMNG